MTSRLVLHRLFSKEAAFPVPQMLTRLVGILATCGLHVQAILSVGYGATINSVQGHFSRRINCVCKRVNKTI